MSAATDPTGKELYNRLKRALLDAFRSHDELREMVRAQLRLSLDVVSLAPDLETCVGDLIEWHESRTTTGALIEAAIAARKGRADLAEVQALFRRLQRAGVPEEEKERRRLEALAATLERLQDQLEILREKNAEPGLAAEIALQIREIRRMLREGFQPLPVGLRVGPGRRYLLSEPIGDGGAAWVYKARDLRAGTDVVIKVLKHPSDHSAEMVRRFREGASVQLRLSREEPRVQGIAEVYEVDGEYEGYLFCVMRHYARGDLGRAVTEATGRIARVDAFTLLIGVADTLAALHARGIAHNDVKPSNVLVDAQGGGWLTDFDLVETSAFTAVVAGRRGTTDFAAPEQLLRGVGGPLVDVYSLGMTALFVLEGRTPSSDVAWRHAPSLDHLNEQPEALRQILERAVAFNPRDRYATMAEFRDALKRARGLAQESGELSEMDVYELLLSVEASAEDRERLWDVVGGHDRVTHPAAPWPSVALPLALEADKQGRLRELFDAILRRWPDAATHGRDRRIRLAAARRAEPSATSTWALFRGLCALSVEQLDEVGHRVGVWELVGRNATVLEATSAVLDVERGREHLLVDAVVRAGGSLRHELPDDADVSGADACLMLAWLRLQGLLPPSIATDPLVWHPALNRHRVEANLHANWAELRDAWGGTSAEARQASMRTYDVAFAFARRLALWSAPTRDSAAQRARVELALACVPRSIYDGFVKAFSVPAWVAPASPGSQREHAHYACRLLGDWYGTLNGVPDFLARAFAEALRTRDGAAMHLGEVLATDGLGERASDAARRLLLPPRPREEALLLVALVRAVEALQEAPVLRFATLPSGAPSDRNEHVALRDAVLSAIRPLEFDALAEDLDAGLGFLPGPSSAQLLRAQEFIKAAEAHGVGSSLRDEVLRRHPDRREAYEAVLLERRRTF